MSIPPPVAPPPPKPIPVKDTKTVNREAFVISKLGERLQRTLWEWHARDDDPSVLDYVVQRTLDGKADPARLPGNRLLVFTHEQEGDDWRGTSILRSAWKPYYEKLQLENMEAIGLERTAGLPVVYPPDKADDDQIQSVEDAVKKMRQGENLYMIMPGPKAQPASAAGGGGEGWLIEDLAIKGQGDGESGMDKAILRKEATMARNVFAEFMRLGHANVGARATSESQADPYYLALTAEANYVADVFTSGVVRPLVEWNYDVTRFPKLRFGKIQANALATVAQAVSELLRAGGVEPTPELEAWLRKTLDAPEKPLEYNQLPASPPSPPPAKPDSGTGEPGQGDAPGEAKGEALSTIRFGQFVPRRPLVGAEKFVAWDQVEDTLDNGAADLVATAEQVMEGQIASAISIAQEAIDRNEPDQLDRVALDAEPLTEALEAELRRLYSAGSADVRAEVRRQLEAKREADPSTTMAIPKIPLSRRDVEEVIKATAKAMAEEAASAALRAIKQRALKTIAQRRQTAAAPGEDPFAEMRAALRKSAPRATNRMYSLGRMDEIRSLHYAGMVPVMRYSAVLDPATCLPCEDWDGTVVRPEEAIELPNPECEGGDACRCQWLPEIAAPEDIALG